MFCSKCGSPNDEQAKYCANCGSPLKEENANSGNGKKQPEAFNHFNLSSVTKEKEVNVTFAILVLVLGLIGIFTAWIPFGFIITMILGFAGAVLQTIVIFQWADVINANVENTKIFLNQSMNENSEKASDFQSMLMHLQSIKIDMTMFWVYLAMYVLGQILSFTFWVTPLVNILAFIFLMIYLQNTFSQEQKLQSLKNRFYGYMSSRTVRLDQIKNRNVGLLILFAIITIGIYWWYLIIKHSQEINDFIDADNSNRHAISL